MYLINSKTPITLHSPAPALKSSLKLRSHLGVGPGFRGPEPYIIWKSFKKRKCKMMNAKLGKNVNIYLDKKSQKITHFKKLT